MPAPPTTESGDDEVMSVASKGRSAEQMIEELQRLARERPSDLLQLANEFAEREVRAPASALYDAVVGGAPPEELERLLDAQVVFAGGLVDAVEIDWRRPADGFTAVGAAAARGDALALATLVRRGADVSICDARGRSPLHLSCGSVACTRELVLLGCPIDTADRGGATPLHLAAGRGGGNIEVVHLLLSIGAPVGATDARQRTPLHAAAEVGDAECLLELLHGGAELEAKDCEGRSSRALAANLPPSRAENRLTVRILNLVAGTPPTARPLLLRELRGGGFPRQLRPTAELMRKVMYLERNPTALTLGNWRQTLNTPRRQIDRSPRTRLKPGLPAAATPRGAQPRSPASEAPTSPEESLQSHHSSGPTATAPASSSAAAHAVAPVVSVAGGKRAATVRMRRSRLVEVSGPPPPPPPPPSPPHGSGARSLQQSRRNDGRGMQPRRGEVERDLCLVGTAATAGAGAPSCESALAEPSRVRSEKHMKSAAQPLSQRYKLAACAKSCNPWGATHGAPEPEPEPEPALEPELEPEPTACKDHTHAAAAETDAANPLPKCGSPWRVAPTDDVDDNMAAVAAAAAQHRLSASWAAEELSFDEEFLRVLQSASSDAHASTQRQQQQNEGDHTVNESLVRADHEELDGQKQPAPAPPQLQTRGRPANDREHARALAMSILAEPAAAEVVVSQAMHADLASPDGRRLAANTAMALRMVVDEPQMPPVLVNAAVQALDKLLSRIEAAEAEAAAAAAAATQVTAETASVETPRAGLDASSASTRAPAPASELGTPTTASVRELHAKMKAQRQALSAEEMIEELRVFARDHPVTLATLAEREFGPSAQRAQHAAKCAEIRQQFERVSGHDVEAREPAAGAGSSQPHALQPARGGSQRQAAQRRSGAQWSSPRQRQQLRRPSSALTPRPPAAGVKSGDVAKQRRPRSAQ